MDVQSQHNASKKRELGSSQQVSHPGSEICVRPKMLHVFQYRCVHVCTCTTALDQTARKTGASRVCCEDYQQRQVGACAHTWYEISLLRQWNICEIKISF